MSSNIVIAVVIGALLLLGLLGFRESEQVSQASETEPSQLERVARGTGQEMPADWKKTNSPSAIPNERPVEQRDDFHVLNAPACWDSCGAPCAKIVDGEAICPKLCESNYDCDRAELCQVTATTDYDAHRSKRCQRSHCQSDGDCGADKTCLQYRKPKNHPFNVCQSAGRRLVGEPCFGDEYSALGQCERGLMCMYGICSMTQECEVSADCQVGEECNHNSCIPGCTTNEDCPGSTECLASGSDGRLQCLDRDSFGCIFEECDAGLDCVRYTDSPAMAATACQAPCESDSECSEGEFCGSLKFSKNGTSKHCFQKCDPVPCKEGWLCVQNAIVREREEITACYLDADEQKRAFMRGFDPPPE